MIAHGYRTAGRPLRRGVVLGAAALLAVLLSRPLAGPVPTAAAQAQAQSRTFNCTGATQSFTVPAGVTQLHVQADGAQGESRENPGGTGGYGEIVTATVPVTPGAVLTIYAGCAGNDGHGGFGFGSGGEHGIGHAADAQSGGGGGGGSAVIQGPIPYETVLVVAGGGGGGGGAGGDTTSGPTGWGSYGGNGGNGGHPAQAGHDGGEGGGGSGRGHGGCAASPDCVQSTNGGAGTSSSVADGGGGGGGGGGGWLGGGGGHGGRDFAELAGGGGGGGGLSYVMPSATHAGYHGPNTGGGNGIVILSWTTSEPGGEAPSPAAPAQPMTISGQVHHLVPPLVSEDQIAQTLTPDAGAQVEALVGSTVCGMAVTGADGRFQLTVGVHPATSGCGQPGATVRFRVDGGEHPEAVLFQSGGAATVALRSTAAPAPPPLGWP